MKLKKIATKFLIDVSEISDCDKNKLYAELLVMLMRQKNNENIYLSLE